MPRQKWKLYQLYHIYICYVNANMKLDLLYHIYLTYVNTNMTIISAVSYLHMLCQDKHENYICCIIVTYVRSIKTWKCWHAWYISGWSDATCWVKPILHKRLTIQSRLWAGISVDKWFSLYFAQFCVGRKTGVTPIMPSILSSQQDTFIGFL